MLAWLGYRRLAAVPVEVAVVQTVRGLSARGPQSVLQATGYVTARRKATVSSLVTGRLVEVLIEEGERVTEGQVLARLDDRTARMAVVQAEAQLAAAQANVEQFDAQLAQARRDRARQGSLAGIGAGSRQELENSTSRAAVLTAQLASQQRQVELARAQLDNAKVQLDFVTIRAPFAGVVTNKSAQPGEIVSPLSAGGGFTRTGVGTIVDMDSLEIEVDVSESSIQKIKAGQPAQIVLDAYPDVKMAGTVIAIVPSADRGKATVPVRVRFDQRDPRVLPDMGVRVSFLAEAARDATSSSASHPSAPAGALAVPARALIRDQGEPHVWVLQGKDPVTARRQVVAILSEVPAVPGTGTDAGTQAQGQADLAGGDGAVVVTGLEASTRVVVSPLARMADGVRVDVRGPTGSAPAEHGR